MICVISNYKDRGGAYPANLLNLVSMNADTFRQLLVTTRQVLVFGVSFWRDGVTLVLIRTL